MSATAMPSHLSPRRLTVTDRIGRVRRSPFARDLARVAPRTSVALLIGLVLAALCCGLYSLSQAYPVSAVLVRGL